MCHGTGQWAQYLHGTNPDLYPIRTCGCTRRCGCGRPLTPGVDHGDNEHGNPLCHDCCTECQHQTIDQAMNAHMNPNKETP